MRQELEEEKPGGPLPSWTPGAYFPGRPGGPGSDGSIVVSPRADPFLIPRVPGDPGAGAMGPVTMRTRSGPVESAIWPVGNTGNQGNQGNQGIDGSQGNQGAQGARRR